MRYYAERNGVMIRAYVCMVGKGIDNNYVGGKINLMNAERNDCMELFSKFMGALRNIIYR